MTMPSVRETPEHVLHREELERRIEVQEEIIRTQADTIATLRRTTDLAEGAIAGLAFPARFHGGQRA